MVKYIDKGTARQHLTDMLMKSSLNNVGVEIDAGELLRYIAEDRLPVWIDDLQIYELEEVVLCGECKHYDSRIGVCHNLRYGDGYANYTPPFVYEDFFCKDGEKMDKEE